MDIHFPPMNGYVPLQGFYLTIVLSLTVTYMVAVVVGYPTGIPTAACTTITPGHGNNTATGSVPYSVNISSLDAGYIPGQNYTSEQDNIAS